jgi:hypothetical protein
MGSGRSVAPTPPDRDPSRAPPIGRGWPRRHAAVSAAGDADEHEHGDTGGQDREIGVASW